MRINERLSSLTHSEWMSWRLKGCWDHGTPLPGSEGTGSLESATRAATDQARTRSGRSISAAAEAFLEHSSVIPAPDRLTRKREREREREKGRPSCNDAHTHVKGTHQYIWARSWLMGRSWETSLRVTTGEAEEEVWSAMASCIRLLPELPLGPEEERNGPERRPFPDHSRDL